MSMHLVGPYMTTTKYNRKNKTSKNKRLAKAQDEHEKFMESLGVGKKQLDEKLYDEYGNRKHFGKIPNYKTGDRKTSDVVAGNGAAKERKIYTGDLIVGIGTMHKSNAVPIMRGTNEAKEIAKMRR
jgi:hypothetical protein